MSGNWHEHALCAQIGGDWWFPEKGDSVLPAKRVCANCPVATQCLGEAMSDPSTVGVWGGTTTRERMKMRRRQGLPGIQQGRPRTDRLVAIAAWKAGTSPKTIALDLEVSERTIHRWIKEAA